MDVKAPPLSDKINKTQTLELNYSLTGENFVILQTQVNPACEDKHACIFFIFLRPFPDLDLESPSMISVYLNRGSLVKRENIDQIS
jgi:hypothetical protein